jgi:hypothetical protein
MSDLNFGINNLPKLSAVTTAKEGGDYTLTIANTNGVVETNSGASNTLTVPTNVSVAFPIGISVIVTQYGAGQTTVAPAEGVTILSVGGYTKLNHQYSVATLLKVDTNTWYLYGDITA